MQVSLRGHLNGSRVSGRLVAIQVSALAVLPFTMLAYLKVGTD